MTFELKDAITIGVVVGGFIANWVSLRKDSKWHTIWIQTHDKDCDDNRKDISRAIAQITSTNVRLTTLAESQDGRLEKVEDAVEDLRRIHRDKFPRH